MMFIDFRAAKLIPAMAFLAMTSLVTLDLRAQTAGETEKLQETEVCLEPSTLGRNGKDDLLSFVDEVIEVASAPFNRAPDYFMDGNETIFYSLKRDLFSPWNPVKDIFEGEMIQLPTPKPDEIEAKSQVEGRDEPAVLKGFKLIDGMVGLDMTIIRNHHGLYLHQGLKRNPRKNAMFRLEDDDINPEALAAYDQALARVREAHTERVVKASEEARNVTGDVDPLKGFENYFEHYQESLAVAYQELPKIEWNWNGLDPDSSRVTFDFVTEDGRRLTLIDGMQLIEIMDRSENELDPIFYTGPGSKEHETQELLQDLKEKLSESDKE